MLLRLLLLVGVSALFTAATCVTLFEQRGPTGPWTGEFVNRDPYVIGASTASSTITDRGGRSGSASTVLCPTVVLPEEGAAFELTADNVGQYPSPPLTASAPQFASEGLLKYPTEQPFLGSSLLTDSGPPRQNAGLYNSSPDLVFFDVSTCAVARDRDGHLLGVSKEIKIEAIDPGEFVDVTFEFSGPMPASTSIDIETRAFATNLIRKNPDGSRVLDLRYFQITLPVNWRYVPAQGIDSFFGEFNGKGIKIFFDYGWYSGNLDQYGDDPQYTVTHETIDGRKATVVTPRSTRSGFTAAHIIVGDDQNTPFTSDETTILLQADDVPSSLRSDVLSIYRSIRFKDE